MLPIFFQSHADPTDPETVPWSNDGIHQRIGETVPGVLSAASCSSRSSPEDGLEPDALISSWRIGTSIIVLRPSSDQPIHNDGDPAYPRISPCRSGRK